MNKKIVTIVGARPQFIKAAMVSNFLKKKYKEIFLHTGQHFDYNMSDLFFEELNIPKPDYNLGISGGSHSRMTGEMMIGIEKVLIKEKPDAVLVYGDTNSTLAGALSAAKLHIPIFHVEAGTRTHCETNPEEINRICTDHISSRLFACTELNMKELVREGLGEKSVICGDLMYDAYLHYSNFKQVSEIEFKILDSNTSLQIQEEYFYLTCHREENTKNDECLLEILFAMNSLEAITIYPVHPRNKERALRLCKQYNLEKIKLIEPVGYIESIALLNGCKAVVTDSGGLQREAFFAEKKCVTVLDFPVWPETIVNGRNSLSIPDRKEILEKIGEPQLIDESYRPFGNGYAARVIVHGIEEYLNMKR